MINETRLINALVINNLRYKISNASSSSLIKTARIRVGDVEEYMEIDPKNGNVAVLVKQKMNAIVAKAEKKRACLISGNIDAAIRRNKRFANRREVRSDFGLILRNALESNK